MNTASNCFQFDAILEEVKDYGSTSTDPAEVLSRTFTVCCQIPSIQYAACWLRRPEGTWEIIESYETELPQCSSAENLWPLLEKAYSTQSICTSSIHLGTQAAKVVLLPILGCESVKGIFSFVLSDETDRHLSQHGVSWVQLGNYVSAALEQSILRARRDRMQKSRDWSKYLVRSLDNAESQLKELNQAPTQGTPSTQPRNYSVKTEPPTPDFDFSHSVESNSVSVSTDTGLSSASTLRTIALMDQNARLVQLATIVGRKLDEKSVAFDIVNELRAYFGFGRFSLGYVRGKSCKLTAISGIETFDVRSGVIVALKALCQQVVKSKTAVWHPEEAEQLPRHFAQLMTRYYEQTDAKSIALLPIFEAPPISTNREDLAAVLQSPDENQGRLVAIICIEGIRHSISKKEAIELWNAVEPIIRNAAANASRHSGLFLYPVWKLLGEFQRLYRDQHRTKALLATLGVFIMAALLCFYPSQLKLKAHGLIQPTNRSRVYAEVAATVSHILAVDGNRVSLGDPLVKLVSPELEIEYERIRGEWSESKQSLMSIRDSLNGYQVLDESTIRQLRKERFSFEEKTRSLEKQMELLELKRSKLTVVSPRAGRIITWDVPQRLGNRPVEPGQHLMTVAEENGPWELELQLPDSMTGYLRKAMQHRPTSDSLMVEFVLASNPAEVHTGKLRRIADTNTFDESDGSVLRVYVDVDESTRQQLGSLKPGTEVIGHIYAGKCSLGYGLFFEFFDWINRLRFKYLW